MADEGNEGRLRGMDLNLYLGLPRSPRPRSSDLGSDLALSSLPLSTSSTTEESRAPEMSSVLEPTDSHVPYSPSHASFTPEPTIQPVDPVAPTDGNSNQEYTPYSPSYEPYAQTLAMMPESEELDTSDSPPSPVHRLPTLQDTEEPPVSPPGHRESHAPHPASYTPTYMPRSPSYIPLDPQEMNDDPLSASPFREASPLFSPYISSLPDVSMYAPPMPSYVHRSPSYSPPSPMYSPRYASSRGAEPMGRDEESSFRRDLFESPEYRFRRLIESSHRLRLRRFRSSIPYHDGSVRSNFGRSASPVPEQQSMHEIISAQQSLEINGKHKVVMEGIVAETSEEKSQTAANFECNVCLDMAQQPVVTSCGHLFCWPCLYQWLHVHSEHKECPVCKGEVTESNITPIYGRGNSEASEGKKLAESGESNVKIPPRPRGNRFESLRQQLRPISRRFGEGITTSWRRLVNQQMRNRSRSERHGDPPMPAMPNSRHHEVLTRQRARRLVSEVLNAAEIGPEAEDISLPIDNAAFPQSSNAVPVSRDGTNHWPRPRDSTISDTHSLFRDGIHTWRPWGHRRDSTTIPRSSDTDPVFTDRSEYWHRFNVYGLYSTAEVGWGEWGDGNGSRYGASTSSVNRPSPEQLIPRAHAASASSAADQVSASSTMAVIQGDVGLPEGSAEPNSAGSSRPYRRRGRSSSSGSLDVDAAVLHACKRRRLN